MPIQLPSPSDTSDPSGPTQIWWRWTMQKERVPSKGTNGWASKGAAHFPFSPHLQPIVPMCAPNLKGLPKCALLAMFGYLCLPQISRSLMI